MNKPHHHEDEPTNDAPAHEQPAADAVSAKHCIGCGVEITDADTPHCGH